MLLRKSLKKDGKEIKEFKLNFDNITGQVIIDAEKTARILGDQTPDVSFSMTFQALIAVAAIEEKIIYDDLLELSGTDFMGLTKQVSNFLFEWALPTGKALKVPKQLK